jgi:Cdc6-like AAA superfamily ATPase
VEKALSELEGKLSEISFRGDESKRDQKIWEILKEQKWEMVVYDIRETPVWLIPLLKILNDPLAYDKKDLKEKRDLFAQFCELLQNSQLYKYAKEKKIWLSHLLWILQTLLIYRKTLGKDQELTEKCNGLIEIIVNIIEKIKPQKLRHEGRIDKETRSLVPEIYEHPDTDIFFSAGWAMELVCLAALDKDIYKIINSIRAIEESVKKAIERLRISPPMHLFHLCLRLWFLLYCWYIKTILTALVEEKKKLCGIRPHELPRLPKIEKNKTYVITIRLDAKEGVDNKKESEYNFYFAGEFLARFEKENVLGLIDGFLSEATEYMPGSGHIPKGTRYSLFILGGAGVGKTTFVEKIIGRIIETEPKRFTPVDLHGIKSWLLERNEEQKCSVLFVDEAHIPSPPTSIFSLMLDPLQEGEIEGTVIKCPVLYVFASSAYKNMEEFLSTAKKIARDGNTSMLDFSTRIGKWITLPQLWQIPKQKYWISFGYASKKVKKEEAAKEIAKTVTLSLDIRNTRDIERKVDEVYCKILRGTPSFSLYKTYLRTPFCLFYEEGQDSLA